MTTAKNLNALSANVRKHHGTGSARALRRDGMIPAIVYGKTSEPLSIEINLKEITQVYTSGRFRTRVLDITLDDKRTLKALPHDVQTHPVTDRIEHVDFIRVEPGKEVRVAVPVKFVGVEKSVGIKRGGTLNIVRHEIALICKPEAIPAAIEVNVAEMNIGSSVHINDIQLPAGVTPQLKRNFTIATVAGRTSQAEETPAAAAAATPAVGAAAPAAGAAAAPAKDAKKK